MKSFILTFLFLFATPVFAWEWNSKAFNESLNKYGDTLKKWTDNPEEIGHSIKERYEPSYNNISNTLKKKASSIESTEAYLIFRNAGRGLEKYGGVSSEEQFFRYLKNDTANGFKWIYYNHEKFPLIGPFKREVESKYDHLWYQTIFFTPIIKREAYKFIPR